MNDVRCTKCRRVIDPIYPPCDCERVSRTPESDGSVSQRLIEAEDILADLATGFWVATLDDADAPVNVKMGQRVLNYWKNATNEARSRTKGEL